MIETTPSSSGSMIRQLSDGMKEADALLAYLPSDLALFASVCSRYFWICDMCTMNPSDRHQHQINALKCSWSVSGTLTN